MLDETKSVAPLTLASLDTMSGDWDNVDFDEDEESEHGKRYPKIRLLGEGQFATVFEARDTKTGELVAVKKIKLGSRSEAKDGVNRTAIREIKLLQELKHEHIINLKDVFGYRSNISLVFDYLDTDLEAVIKDQSLILTMGHIKSYVQQSLCGLDYLHRSWVLHRDLKPNNLLVNGHGVLKIADFGLAKFFAASNVRIHTHQVVTRWYRAPELLYGARIYGPGIDIWAMGCILAELLLRVPFFPGDTDLEQLQKILDVMGNPLPDRWPQAKYLPDYVEFKTASSIPFKEIFTAAGDDLLELLHRLLVLDPNQRCSCEEALKMAFFLNKPHATPGHLLPLPAGKAKQQGKDRKRPRSGGAEGEFATCKKRLCYTSELT